MSLRRFVVISGLPGSGKTTVARALAPLMGLPVIDKDDILERLFDSKGIGDAGWRRQLSRDADEILRTVAAASSGAIVTSFWRTPGMPPDSGTPTDWLSELHGTLVNVHCACPPAIAADRFVRRVRHAGHLDQARPAGDVLASIQALAVLEPLAVGERVSIDTTTRLDPNGILRTVETVFSRSATRTAGLPPS